VKVNFFEASLTFLAKHAKEPSREFWKIFKKIMYISKIWRLESQKITDFFANWLNLARKKKYFKILLTWQVHNNITEMEK
jgi:hypothetical protein